MTHEPKNPYCSVCSRAKTQRKQNFKGTLKLGPRPTEFGEQVTGDLIKNKRNVTDAVIDDEDGTDERLTETDLDISDLANSALVLYDRMLEEQREAETSQTIERKAELKRGGKAQMHW